jgi:hypothetical protein
VRVVLCEVTPALARARQVERGLADPAREQFHHDHAVRIARAGGDWRALPIGPYDPPRLSVPSLVIDTSAGYRPSLDEIVRFAQASS